MSKRKNRKSSKPNLPQETLDRARQEAGLPPASPSPAVDDENIEIEEAEAPARQPDTPRLEPARREMPMPAQASRRKRKPKTVSYEEMTQAEIAYTLEHPTKMVNEAELRAQYSYVLADLRSMGILAAVLFIALIVIAALFI